MLRYLLNRLALVVPTFIGITIVAFGLVRFLSGDPVMLLAGERVMSPERHAQLSEQLGFNRPIWEQYFDYVLSALQGDFGVSIKTKTDVLDQFLTLFPATLELAFCAMLFAIVVGIPAGIFAAIRRGSWAALLPVAVFVVVIDRLQILSEEAALSARFGTDYEDYRQRVPRWLGPV